MTAWEAWQQAQQGAVIDRGTGWQFAGAAMWHTSWTPGQTAPWQWGVEDLQATDWRVLGEPTSDVDRPTPLEAMAVVEEFFRRKDVVTPAWWFDGMIQALTAAYPDMFRETVTVEVEED